MVDINTVVNSINTHYKKGVDFKKKSIELKISSLKEFKKVGEFCIELKQQCKKDGVNFIEYLESHTEIKQKSSQRYMKLITDKRLSKLIDNDEKLKSMNGIGLMKFFEMSKLSDEDFEKVVNGDNSPLTTQKKSIKIVDDTPHTKDKTIDDKDTDGKDTTITIPTEINGLLSNEEYITLIKSNKEFLILRISSEISEKENLKKRIQKLEEKIKKLSPNKEV